MDKESVGFLIFHNRSHRVELRFRKLLYQLVIKVVTDFAGLVENHGCLVTRGRCRPLRERRHIRTNQLPICGQWTLSFVRQPSNSFARNQSFLKHLPIPTSLLMSSRLTGEKPHGTVLRFHSYSTTSTEWLSATSQVKPTVSRNA